MSKIVVSKGQTEAALCEAITKFEKEYMGRGPLETKTTIFDNIVLIRLKGILTKAEFRLASFDKNGKGRDLIKQVRTELIENNRPILEAIIKTITRRKVKSLHTDISTVTGEKIIVFIVDRPFEFANSPSSNVS